MKLKLQAFEKFYDIFKREGLQINMEVIRFKDKNEASQKALEVLLNNIDSDTLLFLSGGTSPDLLYRLLAQNKTLKPGAVAMIDERYGLPMHDNSNEKMIISTGFVEYINKEGIPFYGILKNASIEKVTQAYQQVLQALFKKFTKRVAVMGIGKDGHTAGIKPGLEYDHNRLVVSYDDISGLFGKRITLTFEALEKVDKFLILVFGEDKKELMEQIFRENDPKKIPAVFYLNTSAEVKIFTDILN